MSGIVGIPLLGNNSAPGNYLFESSGDIASQPLKGNIVASVFYAIKGTLLPKLFSTPKSYVAEYGNPDPSVNYAHYCNMLYLEAGFPVIAKRVAGEDASYSWSQFFNTGCALKGPASSSSSNYGLIIPYVSLQSPTYPDYAINGMLFKVTGNASVSLSVTVAGNTYSLGPITTDGTAANTAAQIASYINNIMPQIMAQAITINGGNANINQGYVTTFIGGTTQFLYVVFPQPVANTSSISAPSNVLQFVNQYDFGQSPPSSANPSTTSEPSPYIFQVMAKAPGSYYNNISYAIGNFSVGNPQALSISFQSVIPSGGNLTLNFTFNGSAYSVTSTTGIAGLATALNQWLNSNVNLYNAALTTQPVGWPTQSDFGLGGPANSGLTGYFATLDSTGLVINIGCSGVFVPSIVANGPINITSITGVPSTNSATITQTLKQVESNLSFDFMVYLNSSAVPSEIFRVSLNQQLDHNGNQQFIETVVNNPINGSKYVRVVYNPTNSVNPYSFMLSNYSLNAPVSSQFTLGGGYDGSIPSDSDIATGWDDFADPESIPANILIDGGYSSPIVQQAMDSIAAGRADCETIFGVPTAYQETAEQAMYYRQNILNLNSDRSTLQTPDMMINDPYTGQAIYIPPCAKTAIAWTTTDLKAGPWQTPANMYGVISNIVGLRYKYNKTDRGLLNGAGINVIKQDKNGTFLIYGGKTLLATPSLFQFLSIRRMFTYCENIILYVMEGVDFLNITPQLQTRVGQSLRSILNGIKKRNGFNAYNLSISAVNTTQYTMNGQFNVRLIISPFVPGQFAVLDAEITNSTATFSESTVGNL